MDRLIDDPGELIRGWAHRLEECRPKWPEMPKPKPSILVPALDVSLAWQRPPKPSPGFPPCFCFAALDVSLAWQRPPKPLPGFTEIVCVFVCVCVPGKSEA
jgi:hypothetical protein